MQCTHQGEGHRQVSARVPGDNSPIGPNSAGGYPSYYNGSIQSLDIDEGPDNYNVETILLGFLLYVLMLHMFISLLYVQMARGRKGSSAKDMLGLQLLIPSTTKADFPFAPYK